MEENPYKSPENVDRETASHGPKLPKRLEVVLVGMGASFMLFLVMAISLFLVADWLRVADSFRFPISKRDPERGWAFWYAFWPLAAASVLFGVVAAKRHSQDSQSWVDTVVGLVLVLLMGVLTVVAYLTGGYK
ncbi:MAG TPA: hypothetical protein VMY37_00740 [Thermoguttaceae bacterium]|nr:hypothetical protein [Thermoguttaceae bacterium]